MSVVDYVVMLATLFGIAAYGTWRTRHPDNLDRYLKGDRHTRWYVIGFSVMATQASAITFLSTPGQGYASGLKFVQFYFGLPFALIIISAVFIPIYRRLKVYTAYEYLGLRFDGKTRLLGAVIFLLQRGLAAGITIYAPAIVLCTVLHWPLWLTILFMGVIVLIYTVAGGNEAVNVTQKHQLLVIFVGMAAAFGLLLVRLTNDVSLGQAFAVAGSMGRLDGVDFRFDLRERYTVWSGILGGVFLSLAYFGTDQSQVQRYLSGSSIRASRLGLMFNALLKIPMQFFILLLGVFLFVYYQFEQPPLYFNQAVLHRAAEGESAARLNELAGEYRAAHVRKQAAILRWLQAGDESQTAVARERMMAEMERAAAIRSAAIDLLRAADPQINAEDYDYVFITFVLEQLPRGLIGLLMAAFFAAALSSLSAELSALGETTTVDIYGHFRPLKDKARHDVSVSRRFTLLWGVVAVGFALFATCRKNWIDVYGRFDFYGVALGIFVVAFSCGGRGTAVFVGALIGESGGGHHRRFSGSVTSGTRYRCVSASCAAPDPAAGGTECVPVSGGIDGALRNNADGFLAAHLCQIRLEALRIDVALRKNRFLHRPLDGDFRVVPGDFAFQRRIVDRAAFVKHFGFVAQHAVAVCEPFRDQEHQHVVFGQFDAVPPAERRRVGPDIDRDVPHATAHAAGEFRLPFAHLEMQTAQRVAARTRVVVLPPDGRQPERRELVLVIAFEEESAIVVKDAWTDDLQIRDRRFNDFHSCLRPLR